MKKNFITAIVALLAFGGVMSAQAPETTADNNTPGTETTCHHGKRGDCAMRGRDGKRHGRPDGPRADLFAGIQLTAEQQAALENMRREQRTARDQARKDREAAREQARAETDNRVKEILTPEQYAQYEQNVAAAKARREQMKKDSKDGKRQHGRNHRHNAAGTQTKSN